MKIAVLYHRDKLIERRTYSDHLYSFKRYAPNHDYLYWNFFQEQYLLDEIKQIEFDAVIFHYTLLAKRFDADFLTLYEQTLKKAMTTLCGHKVFVLHDEYIYTDHIRMMAKDCNASLIFSSCYKQDYDTLYPRESIAPDTEIHTVFTGYVDEHLAKTLEKKCPLHKDRTLDIGYRALRSPFYFGKHGQIKTEVAEVVMAALKTHPHLNTDIKLTLPMHKNTLSGNKWIRFLLNSRTALGCLGGSSLLDADGSIFKKVNAYIKEHPNANYEEVSSACYPNEENTILSRLLGPRHFECALTKTCQVLVEGDYHGVLHPNIHYIPIKSDYSNIEDVLNKIQDHAYCQQIAEQCYAHVVKSGQYSYRIYAHTVLQAIEQRSASSPSSASANLKLKNPKYKVKYFPKRAVRFLKMVFFETLFWWYSHFPKQYLALLKIYHRIRGVKHTDF